MARKPRNTTWCRKPQFENCEPRRVMAGDTGDTPDFRLDYFQQAALTPWDCALHCRGGLTTDSRPAASTASNNNLWQIALGYNQRLGQRSIPSECAAPLSLPGAHAQTGLDDVRERWGFTGSGQTVAVIDSGISYTHDALGGGLGSGYRVVGGWDPTENDANPFDDGPYGSHGTHVAGIIGSNDRDNPGVASDVDLVALRVFDDNGAGWFSWVEQALEWVHDHRNSFRNPITTVNLSLGAEWNSSSVPNWAMLEDEFQALEEVGIFISVAAGNSFSSYNSPGLSYPAVSPYVVPVMSTNSDGTLSSFSQRHSRAIGAPGAGIRSTVPDYSGNNNGRGDDWATYSGTSMASPYLAGAAVIVRQALQEAGRTNITQDTINEILRDTADRVYDSITRAYYLRLNLEKAVESILPANDGSTAEKAIDVGEFAKRTTFKGSIADDGGSDFLRFTALRTGSVQVVATSADGMTTRWHRLYADGSARTVNGRTLNLDVKAGREYVVCLESVAGSGNYSAAFRLTPKHTDLGNVNFATLADREVNGMRWFRFDAMLSGTFTAKTAIARGSENIELDLYDANLDAVASTKIAGRYKDRLDATVNGSATYYLRVTGTNANVDLQLANLIGIDGYTLYAYGTSGGDTFRYQYDTGHRVSIKGLVYLFAADTFTNVAFDGGGGNDCALLVGTNGADTAQLRPGSCEVIGEGYQVFVTQTERIVLNARGGLNEAVLHDSLGDDACWLTGYRGTMSGGGFSLEVSNIDRLFANATAGGSDTATIEAGVASDELSGADNWAQLNCGGYRGVVTGFAAVNALTTAGAANFLDPDACDFLFQASGNWV